MSELAAPKSRLHEVCPSPPPSPTEAARGRSCVRAELRLHAICGQLHLSAYRCRSIARLVLIALLALASCRRVWADIDYTIRPNADMSRLQVEIRIPMIGDSLDVQMPSWSPGYYVLQDYWQDLTDLTATDQNGSALPVSHTSGDTWHVEAAGAETITLRYSRRLPREGSAMSIFSGDNDTALVQGPQTYLYVVGQKEEQCHLFVDAPPSFQIAVGLTGRDRNHYFAQNYDVLADNPVTIGALRMASYKVRGIEHIVAIRGKVRDKLNLDKAIEMTKFISTSESDFFGGLPYKKYVWQISATSFPDGAGGVEHATSSQDFLATGEGPGAVRGLAHEYFHLWNVKRIRSSTLGPFDYTKLPQTGALWWLEGVTDYYASLIPHRYRWYGDDEYLKDIARNIAAVRGNPNRLKVSPYDSSLRVGEAADGRGNSNGYLVSYYNSGWLIGMLLDIELRSRTAGKISLDDVEHQLWRECRNDQPGFQENEIRRLLIKFGGADLGKIYDSWVLQPGELPVEEQLAKVGLKLQGVGRSLSVVIDPAATHQQEALRAGWFWGKAKLTEVTDGRHSGSVNHK